MGRSDAFELRDAAITTLVCAGVLAVAAAGSATASPSSGSPDDVLPARIALGFDSGKRCPEVRPADPADAGVALVLFKVGTSGVPSQASIKTTSGSTSLDAAAVKCVSQLRFQPATSWGDGNAVASWQQMAWRWTKPQMHSNEPAAVGAAAAASAPSGAAAPPAGAVATGAVTAGAALAAGATAAAATAPLPGGAAAAGTEVRVCVDASGKLAQDPVVTRSSGDAAFDQAAVKVARSGSGYYRAAVASGKPAAGCMQLAIRPEKGSP